MLPVEDQTVRVNADALVVYQPRVRGHIALPRMNAGLAEAPIRRAAIEQAKRQRGTDLHDVRRGLFRFNQPRRADRVRFWKLDVGAQPTVQGAVGPKIRALGHSALNDVCASCLYARALRRLFFHAFSLSQVLKSPSNERRGSGQE